MYEQIRSSSVLGIISPGHIVLVMELVLAKKLDFCHIFQEATKLLKVMQTKSNTSFMIFLPKVRSICYKKEANQTFAALVKKTNTKFLKSFNQNVSFWPNEIIS